MDFNIGGESLGWQYGRPAAESGARALTQQGPTQSRLRAADVSQELRGGRLERTIPVNLPGVEGSEAELFFIRNSPEVTLPRLFPGLASSSLPAALPAVAA